MYIYINIYIVYIVYIIYIYNIHKERIFSLWKLHIQFELRNILEILDLLR